MEQTIVFFYINLYLIGEERRERSRGGEKKEVYFFIEKLFYNSIEYFSYSFDLKPFVYFTWHTSITFPFVSKLYFV